MNNIVIILVGFCSGMMAMTILSLYKKAIDYFKKGL